MTDKSLFGVWAMARREESKAAHLAAILDASEELLGSGSGAVSLDAIAHRAGFAKGTIYNYFDRKSDILAAVAGRVRKDVGSRILAIHTRTDCSALRLAAGMGLYLDLSISQPSRARIVISIVEGSVNPDAPLNSALLAEIIRGNVRGDLDVHPPQIGVLSVLIHVKAAMSLALGKDDDHPNSVLAVGMLRQCLRALGVHSEIIKSMNLARLRELRNV